MPLTILDPVTALAVIDLQRGLVSFPTIHPIADVVRRSSVLAAAFRRHGLPVVLVTVVGVPPGRTEQPRFRSDLPDDFADLLPELDRQPDDHLVTKRTAGAFTRTDLEAHLRVRGATQLVLAGIATSMGVESTARQAHELGFNVALAVDAMTDMDAGLHANSVDKVFPRLGETGTTAEILDLLDRRA